jgi:hypothetical protein
LIKVGIAAAVSLMAAVGLAVIGDTEVCSGSILAGVGVGVLLGGWLRSRGEARQGTLPTRVGF